MDKNKFWLGGRLFNTASPRLGAPTQRRACPQVGHPNATQGTSASWAPQRTSAMQMQVTSITQGTYARPQLGRPNATQGPKTKARYLWPHQVGHPNAMQVAFAIWVPKRNTRHVRKLGAPMQRKAHPQVGCPKATQGKCNWRGSPCPQRNARHVHTSASWAPQRNARHVRKMVAQTQNSSATKTSTQGSTRLKDELEDG
jgi:hypothetical protein